MSDKPAASKLLGGAGWLDPGVIIPCLPGSGRGTDPRTTTAGPGRQWLPEGSRDAPGTGVNPGLPFWCWQRCPAEK